MGKSILIVDDDELLLETFKMFLEMEGNNVITAASPYKALQLLEDTPIHLAILDYNLPNMNGVQLGHLIHKVQEKVFIMFISGNPDIHELVKKANYNVSAVMAKPIEAPNLIMKVREITGETVSQEPTKAIAAINKVQDLVRSFNISITENNINKFSTLGTLI